MAMPIIKIISDGVTTTDNCFQVSSNLTEGNSLYSHSEVFGSAATLKDVEAFKYFCTINLVLSTINEEMVSIIGCVIIMLCDLFSSLQPHLRNSYCDNTSDQHDKISPSLNKTLKENTTKTCRDYAEIKAYQYMLHNFTTSQNITISSIMYLLQSAAESLQAIQVSY